MGTPDPADGRNCSEPEGDLNASGDIVGYGILAAFFGTATITIIAVILAYLFDAVDNELLNDLDRKVIAWFGWNRKSKAMKTPTANEIIEYNRLRRRRSESFSQFILALSDQQLVTGLAVLVAAISGRERLSQFEFSVAHSLAWFSSTTHLATLDILMQSFKSQNSWIIHLRVFGMLCVLVLLTYTSGVTAILYSSSELTFPVACRNGPEALGNVNLPNIIQLAFTLVLLWGGYLHRLQDLYFHGRGLATFVSLLRSKFHCRPAEDAALSNKQYQAKTLANHRCDLLLRVWSSFMNPQLGFFARLAAGAFQNDRFTAVMARLSLRHFRAKQRIAIYHYSLSLLSTFPFLAFSFIYGILQVIIRRQLQSPPLTPDSTEMSFGQITALFLLVLPFMAAGEVYRGYKSDHLSSDTEVPKHICPSNNDDIERDLCQTCNYNTHFQEIRQYLFTTIECPSIIPQVRQEYLYQLFVELKAAEKIAGFSSSVCYFFLDTVLIVSVAICLSPFDFYQHGYDVGFVISVLLVLWAIFKTSGLLSYFLHFMEKGGGKESIAQQIYLDTEEMVTSEDRCNITEPVQ